jgi:hypothetical protein
MAFPTARSAICEGRALPSNWGEFDACILASPLAALAPEVAQQLDSVELSIFYFQVEPLALPAYYVLCHDSGFAASRIVI